MEFKLMLTLDIDPNTHEVTIVKQEVAKEKIKKYNPKSNNKSSDNTSTPIITLESNKYILNQAACDMLNVSYEDRLEIKYKKIGTLIFPVIGKNACFGTQGGNKLTKSLTVSYRGENNKTLSEYGDSFILNPYNEIPGVFTMQGNKGADIIESDPNINPNISDFSEEDIILPLDTDLEILDEDFDLDDSLDFEL